MVDNICFFEASSMQHALLVIREKYGDDGVILFQSPIKNSSEKIIVCAAKQISDMDSIELKATSDTIKILVKYGFSKNFIKRAYQTLDQRHKIILPNIASYLDTIFECNIISEISTKGKSFIFIGAFGAGKTTMLTKFVKNCIDNTIYPNIYYCTIDKNYKTYDLNIILKKLHLNMKVISINDIETIKNSSNINFIDTQGIDCDAKQDIELITKLISNNIIPIYVVRSDVNPQKLKQHVKELKNIGVHYFIINHLGNKKLLGGTLSILSDFDCTILSINQSGILKQPISLDVKTDIINIINS